LLCEIGAAVGVDFVHRVRSGEDFRIAETLGSGCAILDADGDGALDLYFVNAGNEPGAGAPNRLYRRTEDGTYEDATEASGLGDAGFGTGVAVGDIDNDGDLDVYCGNWGADSLYRNDGDGRFTNVSTQAGLRDSHLTSSIAFFDFDLDGFLDIYVTHYVVPDPHRICRGRERGREFCSPKAYRHVPDTLYRNRGDGTFEDVSLASGIGTVAASGLGVVVADFDDDGWPDVYVANDQVANHLWINQKDGTFRNDAVALGVAYNAHAAAEASMGVAVADLNGDCRPDILCTHLVGETNTLYASRGKAGFEDVTERAAAGRPSFDYTGWGVAIFDVDHDGDRDLAVANGAVDRKAVEDVGVTSEFWRDYAEANLFLLNDGAPHFVPAGIGSGFASPAEVSRGLATGDLDRDGDLDLIVSNISGPGRVFENVAPKSGHWLSVRVIDPALQRDVYGARVLLETDGGGPDLCRTVGAASSYFSSSDPTLHFGVPAGRRVEGLKVRWPGGEWERFPVEGLDRAMVIERGGGSR
jgi:hypothetical protein